MSVILVACPKCSRGYKLPSEHVGEEVRCQCGHSWVVEAPAAKAPPAAKAAAKAEAAKPESVPLAQPAGPEPAGHGSSKGAAALSPRHGAVPPAVARTKAEFQKLLGRSLGTFRIDELLGVGGFGAVFKAFDNSLHRSVAVKVLPSSLARAGKEKVQLFLLEARAAAKLSHPNIVTVHQISEFDHIYFIVMELVEGKSLAELVRRRRLEAREATRIMTEATRGLAHAHKRGLIHRDIKPGNIMVTADGQVKMTDFGLARDIFRQGEDDEEDDGRAIGTPLYMSPEQCEGEEGDARSDVYSMGATYYVALTRRPPYEAADTEGLMNHHRFSPPPDPRKVLPALPAAVFRIIEKAMAKEPDERYQTADELLHAFEGLDFASLDPSAGVTADAVAAQISGITPRVGEHVGAAMKEAVRQVDKTTTRKRAVETTEKPSPLKLYIIIGVGVVVLIIAALVLTILLATGTISFSRSSHNSDTPDLPPPFVGAVSALAPAAAKSAGPASVKPAGLVAAKHPVANSSHPAAPAAAPAATAPVEAVAPTMPAAPAAEPETPAESAEATVPSSAVMAANAEEKLKEAMAYEKKALVHDPAGVQQGYQSIIDYYPDTPAAKTAQAALDRLTGTSEKK